MNVLLTMEIVLKIAPTALAAMSAVASEENWILTDTPAQVSHGVL